MFTKFGKITKLAAGIDSVIWKMRNTDGLYSFRLFGKLEKINGQDRVGWEINGPDSQGILSKILRVEVLQQKLSMDDGRGLASLVKGWRSTKENLQSSMTNGWGSVDFGEFFSFLEK